MAQFLFFNFSTILHKKIVAISSSTAFSSLLSPKTQKIFSRIPLEWKTQAFYELHQSILRHSLSETHKLNDCDALCLAALIHLHSKQIATTNATISTALSPILNGYSAPMGNAFTRKFLEAPIKAEDISAETIAPFERVKQSYAPFETTLIFPSIKFVLRGELLNLIPRPEIQSGEATLHRLRQDIQTWAETLGFSGDQIDTIKSGDFVQLAWRALPNLGPDKYKEILTYGKFLTFLFFHDDIGDNQESVLSQATKLQEISLRNRDLTTLFSATSKEEIYSHFRTSEDPIIRAAVEIMDFMIEISDELSLRGDYINLGYVHREVKNYLEATSKESKCVNDNVRINESLYLSDVRPYTSSLYACFAMSAILQRISIADDVLSQAKVKDLTFLGNELVSLPNDVISFPKEIEQRAFSLVQIKLVEKAIDQGLISSDSVFVSKDTIQIIMKDRPDLLVEAVRDVSRQTNTSMRAFSEQAQTTPRVAKKFIDEVVIPWIPANGDWQNKSERYVRKLGLTGSLPDCIETLRASHSYTVVQSE